MNCTARTIVKAGATALLGLSLSTFSPAFSQKSKMAPDQIQKEITRFYKSNKDAKTLYSGDTLRARDASAPEAKKIRLICSRAKNVQVLGDGRKSMAISTPGVPGYFSGQLQYTQNGRFFSKDISLVFLPKPAPPTYEFSFICKDFVEVEAPEKNAPLKKAVASGKPGRYRPHPIHLSDFFGWPRLEDTRAYGGAIISMDGYGVPNLGLNWDARAARIGKHCAFRYAITATYSAKKFHISGIGWGSMSAFGSGTTAFLEASARTVETYLSMGLEFGSGHLSLTLSPLLGVNNSWGNCQTTTYTNSSSGKVLPVVNSVAYGRWKIFTGANASFSMNFDIVKLAVFGNVKGAFSVEGYPVVPDANRTYTWAYGIAVQIPLLYSPPQ
ncbi:MAG: hypothetical protein WC861_06835 [Candidatus Micrarchaeia archaeon]|jgi:hypothetical protein